MELMVDYITSLDGYGAGEGWPGWWGLEGPEYLGWLGEDSAAHRTLLMGANTWRSLGCKPLVQRRNIVLTSDPEQFGEPPLDTHFISDPNEAFKLLKSDELLVIGGAKVYELFLPLADYLFITEIDIEVEAPDAYFPKFDEAAFHPVQRYPREPEVYGDVMLPAWTPTTRARIIPERS